MSVTIEFLQLVRDNDKSIPRRIVLDLPVVSTHFSDNNGKPPTKCMATPLKNCPNLFVGFPSSNNFPHIFSSVVISTTVVSRSGGLGRQSVFPLYAPS